MYDFFSQNFDNYIIENSKKYLIYLIPGKELAIKFDWYGEQRAKHLIFTKQPHCKMILKKETLLFTYDNLGQSRNEISWWSKIFI